MSLRAPAGGRPGCRCLPRKCSAARAVCARPGRTSCRNGRDSARARRCCRARPPGADAVCCKPSQPRSWAVTLASKFRPGWWGAAMRQHRLADLPGNCPAAESPPVVHEAGEEAPGAACDEAQAGPVAGFQGYFRAVRKRQADQRATSGDSHHSTMSGSGEPDARTIERKHGGAGGDRDQRLRCAGATGSRSACGPQLRGLGPLSPIRADCGG